MHDELEFAIDVAQKTNCELVKISTKYALELLESVRTNQPTSVIEECDSPRIIGRRVGLCPKCGRYLSTSTKYGYIQNYCGICGQALKWTFTEEG